VIVETPRIEVGPDEVRVEATVAIERAGRARPRTLWFSFPPAYRPAVSSAADGLASALLPLAMHLGEPLTVRGPLSTRLAAGLRDYRRIQSIWYPHLFSDVELRCDGFEGRTRTGAPGGVAMPFSGGVDSFHALMTHLSGSEPHASFRVTHCLMIDGFDGDSDPSGTGSFRRIRDLYKPVMAAHGVELLVVRTNLLGFLGPLVRAKSFNTFLTAPALMLGNTFSRLLIPSTFDVKTIGRYPGGSNLMLDHLLSTETMEVWHADAHLSRIEKTLALPRWPETFALLRVCHGATGVQEGSSAIANCCACEKCVRTMVTLDLAGLLGRFTCFPRQLTPYAMRNIAFADPGRVLFAREVIEYAVRVGRRDVARRLRISIAKTRLHARLWPIAAASSRLEKRSRVYAAIVALPKRFLKLIGFGRDWLY